jgi:(1->4)-alpha-D-glucan 1-alpha-D-glucosylmutase
VDPDNRRPVDYESRAKALDSEASIEVLAKDLTDGRMKQHVLSRLIRDRADHPDLYAYGNYTPLRTEGSRASHLVAFTRAHMAETLAVITPRLWSRLTEDGGFPLESAVWGDTRIELPQGQWQDVLTGRQARAQGQPMTVADLLVDMPFAVLRSTG